MQSHYLIVFNTSPWQPANVCVYAVGEHNYQQEPTNEYLLVSARPAWKVIATMLEMGKTAVDQVWAEARGKTSKDFS